MALEEKGSGKPVTRAYLVSMYVVLGLVVGGLAVSIGLFLSGMGEGLCIVFPIALLGATMLLLHSIVTHRRDLLVSAIAVLAVIVLVWMIILFV